MRAMFWKDCQMFKQPHQCPGGWELVSLFPSRDDGIIIRATSGGTPSTTKDEYWDGEFPWLTPKEVTKLRDNIYVSETERTITEEGLQNSAASLLEPGTVMLTKRAPVGAVAINAIPMATNQGFLNFTCGNRLRPLFLAFWLRLNVGFLQQMANGSTYLELYQNDLRDVLMALPPIETQDAILHAAKSLQFLCLVAEAEQQLSDNVEHLRDLQDRTTRLRQRKDYLLRKLFLGEITPSEIRKQIA